MKIVEMFFVFSSNIEWGSAHFLYRIFTERVNVEGIRDILDREFEGYTLLESMGFWKGVSEPSIGIEIDGTISEEKVRSVAEAIKQLNGQDAVLIQRVPVDSVLI